MNLDKAVEVLNEFGHEAKRWIAARSPLGSGAVGRVEPAGEGNQSWTD